MSTYEDLLNQLKSTAAAKAGNWVGAGWGTAPDIAAARNRMTDINSAYTGLKTTGTNGRPRLSDFLTVTPGAIKTTNNGQGMFDRAPSMNAEWQAPTVSADTGAFESSVFSYMRGNARYKDWTDADIHDYISTTHGGSAANSAGIELTTDNRIAYNQAKDESKADRDKMLSELQAFKAGIGENFVAQTLAREKAYWDTKIADTTRQVQEQYAGMGRVASPYMLGELKRRMTTQAADAIAVRRYDLDTEVKNQQAKYLTMLNEVMANTKRNVMDPSQTLQIVQQLGLGAAA